MIEIVRQRRWELSLLALTPFIPLAAVLFG